MRFLKSKRVFDGDSGIQFDGYLRLLVLVSDYIARNINIDQ